MFRQESREEGSPPRGETARLAPRFLGRAEEHIDTVWLIAGVCAVLDALCACPELEVLNVYENGLTDATLAHMAGVVSAGLCGCLREFVAVRNRQEISPAAAAEFTATHPDILLK